MSAEPILTSARLIKWLKLGGWALLLAQVLRFAALVYESPAHKWNDLRLAPTLYLCHGINVFGSTDMPGVSALYGPAALLSYAPAALAHTPEGAIRIGFLCVIVYCLVTLLVPGFLMGRAISAATGRAFSWMLVLIPLAVVSFAHFLGAGMLSLHSDLPAICSMSLAACALASRCRGSLLLGAVLCLFALGCKVTYGAGAAAFFLAAWRLDGLRGAVGFGVMFSALLALVLAAIAATGTLGPMIDAALILPAKQAWVLNLDLSDATVAQFHSPAWQWLPKSLFWKPLCALQTLLLLTTSLLLPVALLLAALHITPSDTQNASTALHRWRITFGSFALLLLPISVLGYTKIGGSLNVISALSLFLLLLVMATALPWLDQHRHDMRLLWLGVAMAVIISLRLLSLAGFDALHAKSTLYPRLEQALKASPDQLWLPTRPLAHWFYQGRVTHSGDVLWCYQLAGREWPARWLQRYLPPQVQYVAGYRDDDPQLSFGLHQELAPGPSLPGLDDEFPVFLWPPHSASDASSKP